MESLSQDQIEETKDAPVEKEASTRLSPLFLKSKEGVQNYAWPKDPKHENPIRGLINNTVNGSAGKKLVFFRDKREGTA